MKHANPNMLLRIAQGDAYCVATEYLKFPKDQPIKDEALKFRKFGQHPKYAELKPGMYSDDTQMSIAVAEVLLSGRPFTREKFADSFVKCFKRDERKGYSAGFQTVLEEVNNGTELLTIIHPDSDKNGAAMRSVPLGVISDVKELLEVAETQAKITHNTPDGILSSQAMALMSHFALYEDDDLDALGCYLEVELPKFTEIADEVDWVPGKPVTLQRVGMKTAMAVVDLAINSSNLLEMTKKIIEWGGDTDSVAAIAWGIASTRMTEDVPEFLETQLEPGRKYGTEFLKKLGSDLMALKL